MQRKTNQTKGLFSELLGTFIYTGFILIITAVIMR